MKYDLWRILSAILIASLLAVGGCDDGDDGAPGAPGPAGPAGAAGVDGADGADGDDGDDGDDGEDGEDGTTGAAEITEFHGTAMLLASGEFATAGKYFAMATITSATADEAGVVTVNYTVADEDGDPATGLGGNYNIVKLVPASGDESFNKWVPYIYNMQEVVAAADQTWPVENNGNIEYQGYRESNGTLTDHGDGSYTYVFAQNLTGASQGPAALAQGAIEYDRTLTHRISVMIGGHSGATADANFDFVPDGSAVTETRDIVGTAVCLDCHGEYEFHGHGGDRLTVENCVTCHNPNQIDPHGGESLDMKVMIHKIHAGGELQSIPGDDGLVWDDPATPQDESADNGQYAIWGYRNTMHEWWKPEFPAVIENCTKCHTGDMPDEDNWKEVLSRDTCGSCHDLIDWTTGVNHDGGAQDDDNACTLCHQTGGIAASVVEAHSDWNSHDPRKVPEFEVALSVSEPANGTHFVAGETPVVTVVLTDVESGLTIDHTTVVEDDDGKDGCTEASCPQGDGKFDHAYLLVHGPRALRNPVLTTQARSEIVAMGGPYDLSGGGSLDLTVDNGEDLLTSDDGGMSIDAEISVDVADGTFAAAAAATDAEVVAWLNADTDFAARAIAYLDEYTGNAAIRSRNLGRVFSTVTDPGAVSMALFGGDGSMLGEMNGYYVSNHLEDMVDPAEDDPKVTRSAADLQYTLDPVDDLQPGTYIASVEITDIGRVNGSDYKTPSVAVVSFQVGQAAEEPAVASNCGSCHWGPDDTGWVLDFPRHYKKFNNTAVDQCGACHDYQLRYSQVGSPFGLLTPDFGAKPISKRVHAVHFGSELNYPNLTVDYNNGDAVKGRNWEIHFPQDILNCETCHPASGPVATSGSWMTNAARLPCQGCHDSEANVSHMALQTYDPTPDRAYSGDEQESCATCH